MTSDFDPPPPASWYAPASDAPKGGTRVHVSWLIAALAAALCLGLGGLAVGYYIGDHFVTRRELDVQVFDDWRASDQAEECGHGVEENRLQQVVVFHLLN